MIYQLITGSKHPHRPSSFPSDQFELKNNNFPLSESEILCHENFEPMVNFLTSDRPKWLQYPHRPRKLFIFHWYMINFRFWSMSFPEICNFDFWKVLLKRILMTSWIWIISVLLIFKKFNPRGLHTINLVYVLQWTLGEIFNKKKQRF